MTWGLIGFSLIAANISAEQFVGMSGQAARDSIGLAVASYEWIAAVTLVITQVLLGQVDETLEAAQYVAMRKIVMNQVGRVESKLTPTDVSSDVYMQIWGLDGDLQSNYQVMSNFERTPFDPDGLRKDLPEYRYFVGPGWHIRVLSIPLEQNGRRLATLQVASKLDTVDRAREDLTEILSIIWVVAVMFSGMAVWITMGQTLKPLGAITETVEQINRADDLSRRIPQRA